jgi:hypothetical protein
MNYGWGLFVAVPFAMGFAASLIYGLQRPRSLASCVRVPCLSAALLGMALMAMVMENMLCLVMARPLALPLAPHGMDVSSWDCLSHPGRNARDRGRR